jgi:sigma-B regulation protein RsbU (phosphoserine phosphatase)
MVPPVKLGVIIFTGFLAALALRPYLQRTLVLPASEADQPKRQFLMDLGLCLLVGVLVMIINRALLAVPIVSGFSVVIGSAILGFFLSLDTALARERVNIEKAISQQSWHHPPKQLYSLTHKFSLIAFTTAIFVATVVIMVFARDIVWLSGISQNADALLKAQWSVALEMLFIMAVLLALVVNLIVSFSRNLKLLFNNETEVLERVSRGDLSRMVPVATKDEFGAIAGHTNSMIRGLRHRTKLINALKLAEEVQQNLLPVKAPQHPGLEIAGTSIYCDETGGDYYDFFKLPNQNLGVVVADAADHGVGSALMMTTARAFMISGVHNYRGPARLAGEINRFLTRDSSKTSRFMSMFFLEIDVPAKRLRWVRAGHEPALLFDPEALTFENLSGEGLVLGVDEDYHFKEYEYKSWTPGSVLVVGTDGIHETCNERGEMFGVDRLKETMTQNSTQSALAIQTAVIDRLNQFRGKTEQEDDVTLVVVKLL